MLLLGTLFWGCGFTWAKAAIAGINTAAQLNSEAAFGAVFSLAVRFCVAAVIWPIIFPAARRGWTWRGLLRSLWIGLLLPASRILQHVGLERTSESVSAFLTSLTVLFVPVLLTVIARRPPRAVLWVSVALATAGVWLMTGRRPAASVPAKFSGSAALRAFRSISLPSIRLPRTRIPWRLTFGQFAVVGLACVVAAAVIPGGRMMREIRAIRPGCGPAQKVGWNLLLLSLLTTMAAFGLLTHFQPRLEPTRATLIYLMEPVIAAVYAAAAAGHAIGPVAIAGAALILCANLFVEVVSVAPEWSPAQS